MKKRALITGITGQDGSYLAEYLLSLDYEVFGFIRRTATPNTVNIEHIRNKIHLLNGDLQDQASLFNALIVSQPDEVYNLAAQSFVGESWEYPVATAQQTGIGALNVLEAIRRYNRKIKFYQASTSEMFGNEPGPQNEKTRLSPRSPYGVSKLFAHHMTINYRESYDMFAVCGILFNHESPRRGFHFVTRKITSTVAKIKAGQADELRLGNLDAKRDWGHAKDYVQGMHAMLQLSNPVDLVLGTGEMHTVKEFVQLAFEAAGLEWEKYVKIDPLFYRPAEVNELHADSALAKELIDWKPKTTFKSLVFGMVASDILLVNNNLIDTKEKTNELHGKD